MATKLGSASRFGPRYGSSLKKIVGGIEKIQKVKQPCTSCGKKSMRRASYARWSCSKCGAVMAGGAYYPKTKLGVLLDKVIRKGAPVSELLAASEEQKPLVKTVKSLKKSRRKKSKKEPRQGEEREESEESGEREESGKSEEREESRWRKESEESKESEEGGGSEESGESEESEENEEGIQ
ncbi:hypothetical protein HY546_02365 [archaeon]|nr:hypothetical protein [archaeon]